MNEGQLVRPGEGVDTHLSATLFSGDRLFPVTVTSLSEEGFAAEGVALDGLDEEFLLEMTLPPIGEPSWSPKAATGHHRGTGTAPSRVRVRARRSRLAPSENGTEAVAGLSGRFEVMTDACRTTLRGWVSRLRAATRSAAGRLHALPERRDRR